MHMNIRSAMEMFMYSYAASAASTLLFSSMLLLINESAAFAPNYTYRHVNTATATATASSTSTALPMYFDFADDPILIPEENYQNLVRSTIPQYASSIHISKSTAGHGHGLYTTNPIPANSIAFTIPLEKCITLDDVRTHPDLGKVLTIMQEDLEEEEGPTASMSAYLASEILREHCAEWEEDASLSGPYADYIKVLPTGRAVSQQDHVLWWNDEEVKRLFEGGAAYEKAMALREWVEMEGQIIEGMLVSDLAEKGMGLSVSQVRGAVTNAFVNVLNRSLFLGEQEEQMLVPVLDMCAHSSTPNVKADIDVDGEGTKCIVVKSTRDISAGEELTLHFYSTEFEGHEWYVMYGFIVPYLSGEETQKLQSQPWHM